MGKTRNVSLLKEANVYMQCICRSIYEVGHTLKKRMKWIGFGKEFSRCKEEGQRMVNEWMMQNDEDSARMEVTNGTRSSVL